MIDVSYKWQWWKGVQVLRVRVQVQCCKLSALSFFHPCVGASGLLVFYFFLSFSSPLLICSSPEKRHCCLLSLEVLLRNLRLKKALSTFKNAFANEEQ